MKIIHIKSIREERHFMRGTILDYWRWNPVGATTLSRLVLQQTKENGLSWDQLLIRPRFSKIQISHCTLPFACMLHAHFTSHRLQMCFYFLFFCFKLRSKRCMQHLLTVLFFFITTKTIREIARNLKCYSCQQIILKMLKKKFF